SADAHQQVWLSDGTACDEVGGRCGRLGESCAHCPSCQDSLFLHWLVSGGGIAPSTPALTEAAPTVFTEAVTPPEPNVWVPDPKVEESEPGGAPPSRPWSPTGGLDVEQFEGFVGP